MASIIDYCNETFSEHFAVLKFLVYAAPVYFVTNMFLVGDTKNFNFWAVALAVLFMGVLATGINNVRLNRTEILTFNIKRLFIAIVKGLVVVLPLGFVFYYLGSFIISLIKLPKEVPHGDLIVNIVIWVILASILLTSFLSFSKYIRIKDGYNFKAMLESCMDVFVSILFFSPQLLIANVIFVGPVWCLFKFFNWPLNHWAFVAFCCLVFVINISILSNYFAQLGYEHIRGKDGEYEDKVQFGALDHAINKIDE